MALRPHCRRFGQSGQKFRSLHSKFPEPPAKNFFKVRSSSHVSLPPPVHLAPAEDGDSSEIATAMRLIFHCRRHGRRTLVEEGDWQCAEHLLSPRFASWLERRLSSMAETSV